MDEERKRIAEAAERRARLRPKGIIWVNDEMIDCLGDFCTDSFNHRVFSSLAYPLIIEPPVGVLVGRTDGQ
eukprot:scaffold16365_cov23-Prasinocladus_malaysianus.AAC.1